VLRGYKVTLLFVVSFPWILGDLFVGLAAVHVVCVGGFCFVAWVWELAVAGLVVGGHIVSMCPTVVVGVGVAFGGARDAVAGIGVAWWSCGGTLAGGQLLGGAVVSTCVCGGLGLPGGWFGPVW
jgi:hypothetical protein